VGQATQAVKPLQVIGQDASLRMPPASEATAPLMVVILGETARAANFGLGGYARDTTPELRKIQAQGDLVYFSDVKSCGTSTQASVPCMFSHLEKAAHEDSKERFESVLDVLQRAGLAVLWLDNQSGCKGVCDRVPNVATTALKVPEFCTDGECLDEVMLHELPKHLAALDPAKRAKGTVVWTPVKGEGNALVGGSWKIVDQKKSTGLELKINGKVEVPLPGLMKMVVTPVVSSEFEKLVEKYIANLIKKFGGEV
jgi:lipid A ethanolaminephosphotransferase